MTLCPIAIATGCKKCWIVSVCPLKGIIGDFKPAANKKSVGKKTPVRSGASRKRKS